MTKAIKMAVRISLNQLTQDQKDTIRKYLYMQPLQTQFFKNAPWMNTTPDPVLMFWIDKPNNEIVLPYIFANSLLNSHINSQKTYPSGHYDFTGSLREKQIPVVNEAMEQLKQYGTTTLRLPTGYGKTAISAYLGSKLDGLVLVVMNKKSIRQGWISTFENLTNAQVWVNGSKQQIPDSCNVILTMNGTFHKIPEKIKRLVSVFIIDEAHLFCTQKQVPVLLGTCPKYVIACTATFEKNNGMHTMIESIVGKHFVFREIEKRFAVYKLETSIKNDIPKNKRGNADWSQLVKLLAFNEDRNRMIIDLIENNPKHKIIVLSWNKEHVYLLTKMLQEANISVDNLTGTKSSYKDSKVLISTYSKAGQGFDEKNTCENFAGKTSSMLILSGSTKSIPNLKQYIGRVFRSDFPVIIDLVDDNRICKSHWRERRKHYENPDLNCVIHEIKMYKQDQYESNSMNKETDSLQVKKYFENRTKNEK